MYVWTRYVSTAYEKQKQDYQKQLEGYQGEHSLYRAQSSDYIEDEHAYDIATGEAPAVVVVGPPAAAVVAPLLHSNLFFSLQTTLPVSNSWHTQPSPSECP